MKTVWTVALGVGGILVLSGQGIAAPPMRNVQLRVSYADLNIHSRAGAQVLLNRLEQAAGAACGTQPTPLDIIGTHAYNNCRKAALKSAVGAIGSPELVAVYNNLPATERVATNSK